MGLSRGWGSPDWPKFPHQYAQDILDALTLAARFRRPEAIEKLIEFLKIIQKREEHNPYFVADIVTELRKRK